jgi:hypothetical protein
MMNERIRELLEQAGFDVETLVRPYPGGFPREDMLALESFAQLIVQECGQWIIDNAGAMEHLGPEYFAKAMIKDFGVES